MTQLKEKYVTDHQGRKVAVMLEIKQYQKLQEYLEDLQDALDLKGAKATAKKFIPFEEMRRRLKS